MKPILLEPVKSRLDLRSSIVANGLIDVLKKLELAKPDAWDEFVFNSLKGIV